MASWPIRKCSERVGRKNGERAEGTAGMERREGMVSWPKRNARREGKEEITSGPKEKLGGRREKEWRADRRSGSERKERRNDERAPKERLGGRGKKKYAVLPSFEPRSNLESSVVH